MMLTRVALLFLLSLRMDAADCFAAEVKDSGILLSEYARVYWIDDQRVIFLTPSDAYCARSDEPGSYKVQLNRIAVFNIRTGKTESYGALGIDGLCFAYGHVSYGRRERPNGICHEDKWERFSGKFGEEAPVPNVAIERDSCLPFSELPPLPRESKDHVYVRLRPEHGYVEFNRMDVPPHYSRRFLAKLHRPDGEIVDLSHIFTKHVDRNNNISSRLTYEAWKAAYVVRIDHNPVPLAEGVTAKLWWLYPDGRVEEIISYVRDRNWPSTNVTSTFPARSGVYFTGAERKITPYIGQSGLYRHSEGNKFERLVAGRIGPRQLSPDGCKLALGNDPRGPDASVGRQFKLQVIDLCKWDTK